MLSVKNLTVALKDSGYLAIEDLSFEVEEGGILVVT